MTSKYSRVSGFNPRFIVWWIKGCRTPTTVTFPTRRLATRTRQNLYALRGAMHKEDHHAAHIADKAEIIRRPVDPEFTDIHDPHTLTICPANFDMNDILDAAGIDEPPLDEGNDGKPFGGATPTTIPKAPRPFDYAHVMKGDNNEEPEDEASK